MKALIPAAGLGTRWHPWSKVIPKELLPLARYPAIHYVLEETVAAGILEIGIIISNAKKLIKTYVDEIWKSERSEAKIMWFYQSYPRGVTDALLCAKEWIEDSPTAVLYPDEIHPVEGGLVQLLNAYETFSSSCIGFTAEKQNRRQATLKIEKTAKSLYQVYEFSEQDREQQIGYGTGRYILDSGLRYLGDNFTHGSLQKSEELDDDKVFQPLFKKGIMGLLLSDPIFDIGTPENWLYTLQHFSLISKS
jgi:UTP-glucose-1-phosphate uridylyltransferase